MLQLLGYPVFAIVLKLSKLPRVVNVVFIIAGQKRFHSSCSVKLIEIDVVIHVLTKDQCTKLAGSLSCLLGKGKYMVDRRIRLIGVSIQEVQKIE